MAKKERCEACSIQFNGHPELETELVPFRGHKICKFCHRIWLLHDRRLGREAKWSEILNPNSIMEKVLSVSVTTRPVNWEEDEHYVPVSLSFMEEGRRISKHDR